MERNKEIWQKRKKRSREAAHNCKGRDAKKSNKAKNRNKTHPDLTSHTLNTLSQPPLTTSALGCPQPRDAFVMLVFVIALS
jgi:hypothetical protein